jgi:hypothetical protein
MSFHPFTGFYAINRVPKVHFRRVFPYKQMNQQHNPDATYGAAVFDIQG